jgi:hypothetical protein
MCFKRSLIVFNKLSYSILKSCSLSLGDRKRFTGGNGGGGEIACVEMLVDLDGEFVCVEVLVDLGGEGGAVRSSCFGGVRGVCGDGFGVDGDGDGRGVRGDAFGVDGDGSDGDGRGVRGDAFGDERGDGGGGSGDGRGVRGDVFGDGSASCEG